MKKKALQIENANKPYLQELLDLFANPGSHPNAFLVGPELQEAGRSLTKFVVESTPPPDLPPGKDAWVTNEEQGFVMHVLSSALEKLPGAIESLSDLFEAAMRLGPLLVHEYAHKKNKEGIGDELVGEPEAEAAQNRAEQDLASRYEKEIGARLKAIDGITKLSSELDSIGCRKYSDVLDVVLSKIRD